MTHENFKLHMDGVAAVYVSRHDNGTVFLYTTNTDGPEGAQQNVLVILDQDEAVKVANAMLGPIKVMSVQEHIADMTAPCEWCNVADHYRCSLHGGPTFLPPLDSDPTLDAPALTDADEPEDFEPEPYFEPFASYEYKTAKEQRDGAETLGFERGYTNGYGDRVMEEQGIEPDGYNDPDSYQTTARILKLEVDLFARDEINGTTF